MSEVRKVRVVCDATEHPRHHGRVKTLAIFYKRSPGVWVIEYEGRKFYPDRRGRMSAGHSHPAITVMDGDRPAGVSHWDSLHLLGYLRRHPDEFPESDIPDWRAVFTPKCPWCGDQVQVRFERMMSALDVWAGNGQDQMPLRTLRVANG